jgi:putative DNA primase/helicase
MHPLSEHALALATTGTPVFPCGSDKKPLTPHGFLDATSNLEAIQAWWARWPDALVGVPTGRTSGLIAVDVDPDGIAWAQQNWIALAAQRIHATRRGWHLLYTSPADREVKCSASQLGAGVDVRADGGYIIWWPAAGLQVSGAALGPMPQWLLDRVSSHTAGSQGSAPSLAVDRERIGEGMRNDFLSREAYRQRKQGASVDQLVNILRAINDARCEPPLDDAEVRQIAQGKSRVTPVPEPGPMDVGFGKSPLPAGVSPVPLHSDDLGVELVCAEII